MGAVVFACTKFHDYILGKTVTIETDHKPLVTIFKKSIDKASARLQNMLLKAPKVLPRSNLQTWQGYASC